MLHTKVQNFNGEIPCVPLIYHQSEVPYLCICADSTEKLIIKHVLLQCSNQDLYTAITALTTDYSNKNLRINSVTCLRFVDKLRRFTCTSISIRVYPPMSAKSDANLFPAEEIRNALEKQEEGRFEALSSQLRGSRNMVIRPLQQDDYKKGYMQLLAQCSNVTPIPEEVFLRQFRRMQALNGTFYVVVIEDLATNKIVATGSLEIQYKFIHSVSLQGRIEDLMVDREEEIQDYRYQDGNLASILTNVLVSLAKSLGCYKIHVDSPEPFVRFYNQFGFTTEPGIDALVARFLSKTTP
ncbi:glucosamine 6-phosphate N-acetyltransferase-like [Paramacrobiotus metropolitanus]|uniref:glucosamine 6-phosphate N-acetyltransferase-like n=1 Tax=Paramacrobiotus metropolitanus TaxID=2943436 RepID=UPI0024462D28|nr:glucosamine 6-phosphate N-acetyltransferase-like [Paramacrobiotus metropolitanus]